MHLCKNLYPRVFQTAALYKYNCHSGCYQASNVTCLLKNINSLLIDFDCWILTKDCSEIWRNFLNNILQEAFINRSFVACKPICTGFNIEAVKQLATLKAFLRRFKNTYLVVYQLGLYIWYHPVNIWKTLNHR